MNALIFSALSGVIMMFSSFLLKSKSAARILAHILLIAVIIVNVLELRGAHGGELADADGEAARRAVRLDGRRRRQAQFFQTRIEARRDLRRQPRQPTAGAWLSPFLH